MFSLDIALIHIVRYRQLKRKQRQKTLYEKKEDTRMPYKIGDIIHEPVYILKGVSQTTQKGKPFFSFDCRMRDGTEFTGCKLWNSNKTFERIVTIDGRVDEFNGALQIIANDISDDTGGLIDADFLSQPPQGVNIDDEIKKFRRFIQKIANESIRKFVDNVITYWSFHTYPDLKKLDHNRFYDHPGAQSIHHTYRGGLLHHTNEIIHLAMNMAEAFDDPKTKDIVLAGAILHDIGKMYEFEVIGASTNFTDAGFLYGCSSNAHLYIGSAMLNISYQLADENKIDAKTFFMINNIILSHHGDYGDVKPGTIAAEYVHFADNASAKKAKHDQYFRTNPTHDRFSKPKHARAYMR